MAKTVNERELVLDILLSITRDNEYSHIVLKAVLDKHHYLEKRERAFITRMVEGTLERMIELDFIINQFSKVKVNKMKPVIRTIIRSAVYQLKYMDSVPNSAVCNEAVKLTQKRGFASLKGFVNGVLRNIERNLEHIQYPDQEKDFVRHLSVCYSMPEWILEQWLAEYDRPTVATMLKEFMTENPLTIRFDPERINKEKLMEDLKQEGITVQEHSQFAYALMISGYDRLEALASFCRGDYQVQDISSMKVAELADPQAGDYVIDVCAAPGGKALHIAEKLAGTGMVEARDISEFKVGLIEQNIVRSGLKNIKAVRQDGTQYIESSKEKADLLIADLPCSGLGVLRKKTDLKYKMTPEMQKSLVRLQREILAVSKNYVKPGGRMVYSTCTIHRAENQDNTCWFLAEHPDFQLLAEEQMMPGKDGGDGFYIAVLKRKADE